MIVRISGEDQYRLASEDGRLHDLDNAVVAAVQAGDEDAFHSSLGALLDYVRSSGSRLADDELLASDLILPPVDITLAELGEEFTGEGLIPD
jgi:PspA-Associated protein